MRALLLIVAIATVLGACGSGSAGTGGETSLRITYWPQTGTAEGRKVWTLRCHPAGGTLPRRANACRRLAAGGPKLFASVPHDVVCTEIYGGPQRARVVGTVRGKRVATTFNRVNGCEIDRWNRLSPWLLPRGGTST